MEKINIYLGIRGKEFKNFIYNLLKLGNLEENYINELLSNDSLQLYSQAFTSKTADSIHNYEYYELLGDVTINKIIVWYIHRKFTFLEKSEGGVPVMARIKIKLQQKENLFRIGERLEFFKYISATDEERNSRMRALIEDSVEAFFGVTEYILDNKIRMGVGYHICYNILEYLLNETKISLKFEDLFDAKTRLKESFDYHRLYLKPIGKALWTELIYESNPIFDKDDPKKIILFSTTAFNKDENGKKTALGFGKAAKKDKSEQAAAEDALKNFSGRKGYLRPKSQVYLDLEEMIAKIN